MQTRGDTRHSSGSRLHSVTGRIRRGAAAAIVVVGAIFLGGAASLVTAFAHSGTVAASESCQSWTATVTLANNVTIDRFVEVVTTIPGTTGITNGHYDTSKGLIWDATGPAPATGTVTLNIYYSVDGAPGALEFTASATIQPATGCMASPSISTKQSAGGTVAIALTDTATVTGGNNPTGTVTFNLYAPGDTTCAAHAAYTNIANLSSGGKASSGSFTSTVAGTYHWIAQYSGDANNTGATSGCQDEAVTVVKAGPAISTTPSGGGAAPTMINDSATVTGGVSPTGTVTFELFATTDLTCAGAAIFSSTVNLTSATVQSGSFTAAAAGTYHWTAAYSGDANNAAVTNRCADESAVITAPGGVQGITTPSTGGAAALGEMTLGAVALLAGLGMLLIGANVPRRYRV